MNVLWIDDEHETLELIKDSALEYDITLQGFRSADLALLELEKPENYNAVVLDGLFYLNQSDKGTPSSDTAFGKVAKELYSLKQKGIILPWFILSGKTSFTLAQNSTIEIFADKDFAEGKVFDKKKQEEKLLWTELIKAVSEIPLYKLKQEYRQVFDTVESIPSLQKHSRSLIDLLKNIDTQQDYTTVRKILESLFKALSDVSIIPPRFVGEQGWINGTAKFISCTHPRYDFYEKDFIHSTISESLSHILNLVQDASHNEGELNYKIDDYCRVNTSGYLYKSVIFCLLEIIVYFCQLIKDNPDPEQNKTRWAKVVNDNEDWRMGHIDSFSNNGWAKFICDDTSKEIDIPPNYVKKNNLTIDMEFEMRVEFNEPNKRYYVKEIII